MTPHSGGAALDFDPTAEDRRVHRFSNLAPKPRLSVVGRRIARTWEKPFTWPMRLIQGEKFPGFWWHFGYLVPGGLFRGVVQVRYAGLDNIPKSGGALMVSNHVSHVDPILVWMMIQDSRRLPTIMAKEGLFNTVAGHLLRGIGAIAVPRGHGSDAAITAASAALRNGKIVAMMPEGTITKDPDGWPQPAKSGAARIALECPGVPVIPVAQWGVQESFDFYNLRLKWLKRTKHRMIIGTPLDISADATIESITAQIDAALRNGVAELRS